MIRCDTCGWYAPPYYTLTDHDLIHDTLLRARRARADDGSDRR